MFETILHAVTYCTQSCSHSNEAMPYQDPDYGSLTLIHNTFMVYIDLWWKIEVSFSFSLTCIACVITRIFYLEHIKCIHWLFIIDVIVKMTL